MGRLQAIIRTLVRLSAAIALASALSANQAGAQADRDRCPPPAFERIHRDPSEHTSFLWRSDVEHRDATHCRYEKEIENRVVNQHDSNPIHFTWEKAGLVVPRSAPLWPGRARSHSMTVPPGTNAAVAYNTPLYYGSKPGIHANTNVYVLDDAETAPEREASFFKLFSRIVGNGQTAEGKVEDVALEASSFTDLGKSDASVSFTTVGPVRSLALSGLRDAPFIDKREADRYFSLLQTTLREQALFFELVGAEEIGFEPDDNSHYSWMETMEFVRIDSWSGRVQSLTIPLPRAAERATPGKLFAVILDAKGKPAGTGFVSAVFAPVPKR